MVTPLDEAPRNLKDESAHSEHAADANNPDASPYDNLSFEEAEPLYLGKVEELSELVNRYYELHDRAKVMPVTVELNPLIQENNELVIKWRLLEDDIVDLANILGADYKITFNPEANKRLDYIPEDEPAESEAEPEAQAEAPQTEPEAPAEEQPEAPEEAPAEPVVEPEPEATAEPEATTSEEDRKKEAIALFLKENEALDGIRDEILAYIRDGGTDKTAQYKHLTKQFRQQDSKVGRLARNARLTYTNRKVPVPPQVDEPVPAPTSQTEAEPAAAAEATTVAEPEPTAEPELNPVDTAPEPEPAAESTAEPAPEPEPTPSENETESKSIYESLSIEELTDILAGLQKELARRTGVDSAATTVDTDQAQPDADDVADAENDTDSDAEDEADSAADSEKDVEGDVDSSVDADDTDSDTDADNGAPAGQSSTATASVAPDAIYPNPKNHPRHGELILDVANPGAGKQTDSKYDLTWDEYIKHRPGKGTYPDADGRARDAETEKFASDTSHREALVGENNYLDYDYASSKQSLSYYDTVNGVDNRNNLDADGKEKEASNFENLSITELARELARTKYHYHLVEGGKKDDLEESARIEAEIRAIAKAKYLEKAQNSGIQELIDNYEKEMDSFESMAERYLTAQLGDEALKKQSTIETVESEAVRAAAAAKEEAEKGTIKGNIKKWWKGVKGRFGVEVWEDGWNSSDDPELALNKDVTPEKTWAEKQEIKKDNRYKTIIGRAVVFAQSPKMQEIYQGGSVTWPIHKAELLRDYPDQFKEVDGGLEFKLVGPLNEEDQKRRTEAEDALKRLNTLKMETKETAEVGE